MSSIKYNEFIENCKTGDILLFSSNAIYSRLIELLSFSKFSHVAYIVRDPIWINPDMSGIYIYQSGLESTIDEISKEKIFGVQLTPLKKIEDNYKNGYFGYLYYVKNDFERTEEYYYNLKKIILDTDKKKYDLNLIDWIKARFDCNIGQRKENKFFCSALVSFIMENLNQIDEKIDWTYVSPRRFSKNSSDVLPFINCTIHPEKFIIF
jgi:hypothetical protein